MTFWVCLIFVGALTYAFQNMPGCGVGLFHLKNLSASRLLCLPRNGVETRDPFNRFPREMELRGREEALEWMENFRRKCTK